MDISQMLLDRITHLDNTISKLGDNLSDFSKTLTGNALETAVLKEKIDVANKRIFKIESSLSRINWTIITAVVVAILGLIIK